MHYQKGAFLTVMFSGPTFLLSKGIFVTNLQTQPQANERCRKYTKEGRKKCQQTIITKIIKSAVYQTSIKSSNFAFYVLNLHAFPCKQIKASVFGQNSNIHIIQQSRYLQFHAINRVHNLIFINQIAFQRFLFKIKKEPMLLTSNKTYLAIAFLAFQNCF